MEVRLFSWAPHVNIMIYSAFLLSTMVVIVIGVWVVNKGDNDEGDNIE